MDRFTGLSRIFKRFSRQGGKPLYITSPIFYVNAKPHLGHLYTMLLCDSRYRWEKQKPNGLGYFLTGTDEHGLKIQGVAEKMGVAPKELTDRVSENFKSLAEKMDIQYDRFIRTTDADHVTAVQKFWNIMRDKGLLYQGSHSGWYSISDETFYPESQIEEVSDPQTGVKKMVSKETRNEVTFETETNYFFKMAQFQSRLIEFLQANPDFVKPKSRYLELVKELNEFKLSDLSVSRPSSRLSWGIDVPGDKSQKVYVWFDALINYLTACGKLLSQNSSLTHQSPVENLWPATHVIGKDITRFHCIYWPIFLMAAGIELPQQVFIHSHWLCDGFKMSKSLGNVVDPIETADYYGVDALRFFLLENSNIENDCNFSEEAFYHSRESIIGKYANLATRCGGAAFNIEQSVELYKTNQFQDIDTVLKSHGLNSQDINQILVARDDLITNLSNLFQVMNEKMTGFDQMKAIQCWWSVVEKANSLFQLGQPWLYTKHLKSHSTPNNTHAAYQLIQGYFVFLMAETCRITSILINPIVPGLSSKILDRLNVSTSNRHFAQAYIGSDLTYGAGANGKKHPMPIQRVPIRQGQT